ncbi:MAG: DUF2169 domain-containing protein [Myxococcota bacterium]
MIISTNTTGMEANRTIIADKEARDHCLVVVKGTFDTDPHGHMKLAREQAPLVYADDHYGDPETSSIRYGSDFPLYKPYAEVSVVGFAVPPNGQKATRLGVRLEVEGKAKDISVVGDRRWARTGMGFVASDPVPFREMPLTYERAFGGTDDTKGKMNVAVEHRNLAGVGFNPHRPRSAVDGLPLPNLEHPKDPLTSVRDRVEPVGLGVLGRHWKQRVGFAGTYDQKWLDEICPFLPADFDSRYCMGTAQDQWFPFFKGGELIRCVHMAIEPVVQYRLPTISMPIRFVFVDRTINKQAVLDTVVVEPHAHRALLTWRASVPIGKKLNRFFKILVGEQPRPKQDACIGWRNGKPHFRGLAATLDWLRKGRRR